MAKDLEQEIPLRGSNSKVIHSADIENNNNNNSSAAAAAAAAAGRGGSSSSLPRPKVYKKWSPWLIVLVVIANVVMFIITMYVNNCPKYSLSCVASSFGRFSFQPFKENPLLGPSSSTLEKMGALDVNKVVHHNQGWRLISCIWLHGGVFHLLANMLSLLIIGIRLEREFGFIKIGLLYMIAGLGGSLMSALFVRSSISVGASGAVFGLLGAMLSELIINWTIYRNKISSLIMLILIVVINLGVGILPHVDNFAHIGGFISGFFLGFVFLIRPQFGWIGQNYMLPGHSRNGPRHKYKIYQCALWIISLIVLIVGFAVALILLFKGVDANAKCSWCHYLSCVPTSRWSCNTQPVYCTSEQMDNQLNLTCPSNGKSKTYFMPNLTESQIRGLCTELCG